MVIELPPHLLLDRVSSKVLTSYMLSAEIFSKTAAHESIPT